MGLDCQIQDKCSLLYTLWTFPVFLITYIYIILDWIFDLSFIFVIAIGIKLLIWTIVMLIALFKNVYRGNWCRVNSIIAAPIIVVIFFGLLSSLNTENRIRLEYNKASYMKDIAEIQNLDGSPRIKTWNWGASGLSINAGGCIYKLIYDESDQIALRKADISNHTKTIVKHIDDHFYLVEYRQR